MAVDLDLPYEIGALYDRTTDIHDRYNGQEQGGICTPAGLPLIFAFTGVAGTTYGYHDHWDDEAELFYYFGEGQSGDMKFVRGNAAIRDHKANGKRLYVFQQLGKGAPNRFRGEYEYVDHELRQGVPGKDKKPRTAIVFVLRPLQSEPEDAGEVIELAEAMGVADTESPRVVKIRTKQRQFKRNLLTVEKGCRLTGIADLRFLRASHIKPWAKCELSAERIDGNNGLLLCPQADFLFDGGWITFKESGRLVVASGIPKQVVDKVGFRLETGHYVGKFNREQVDYLRFHQDKVFESWIA